MRWAMLTLLMLVVACHPLSTQPYEPTLKQKVAQEQHKQSGLSETYDGMDCYKYYESQLVRCDASWDCTARQKRILLRDATRVRASYSCRIYFSDRAKRMMSRGR